MGEKGRTIVKLINVEGRAGREVQSYVGHPFARFDKHGYGGGHALERQGAERDGCCGNAIGKADDQCS